MQWVKHDIGEKWKQDIIELQDMMDIIEMSLESLNKAGNFGLCQASEIFDEFLWKYRVTKNMISHMFFQRRFTHEDN